MPTHRIDDIEPSAPGVGVALFDFPFRPADGWFSKGGSEPIRIRSPKDLPTDMVIVTNVHDAAFQASEICQVRNARPTEFFRSDLHAISKEIGLPLRQDPYRVCSYLSEIADRAMRLAYGQYGFSRIGKSLRETLAPTLISDVPPKPTEDTFMASAGSAMMNAFKASHSTGIPSVTGANCIRFRWSRTHHARLLSRLPVPVGNWHRYDGPAPPDTAAANRGGVHSDLYRWLSELADRRPVLLRVAYRHEGREGFDLIDPSSEVSIREWMPIQEAMALLEFGRITIRGVLVGDGYSTLNELSRFGPPEQGPAGLVSLSNGLVAESFWLVLASLRFHVPGLPEKVPTPISVWLRAWDRLLCLKAARAFSEKGIRVRSYGIGGVNVFAKQSQLDKAIQVALASGLTVPAWAAGLKDTGADAGDGPVRPEYTSMSNAI